MSSRVNKRSATVSKGQQSKRVVIKVATGEARRGNRRSATVAGIKTSVGEGIQGATCQNKGATVEARRIKTSERGEATLKGSHTVLVQ